MEIQQAVDLGPFNSFGVHAIAAEFAELTESRQLPELLAYAETQHLPVLLLGDGSNVLLVNDFPGLVIHMGLQGIQWDEAQKRVCAAAGENWHNLVKECLKKGLHGIENLALIPGSVGAAPVQNIGAYGVELEGFIESVEVFDREQGQFSQLSRSQCDFAYRDSVFKREEGANLIITAVNLQLGDWQPVLDYSGIQEALGDQSVTPQRLFDAVCRIRRSKLPDPAHLGNAGSFFKNPLITADKYKKLLEEYPEMPSYQGNDPDLVKVPAAWLLDSLGWKGRQRGSAAVHEQHALVLVNHDGNATGEDVFLLAQEMSSSVLSRYGIALQPEVRIL